MEDILTASCIQATGHLHELSISKDIPFSPPAFNQQNKNGRANHLYRTYKSVSISTQLKVDR
jgi:hypothetical protein